MVKELKSKFIRVPQATAEYFGGDDELMTEVAIANGLLVFARLGGVPVRFAPHGVTSKPTGGDWDSLPSTLLSGHYPISLRHSPHVFTSGAVPINRVWVRNIPLCNGERIKYSERPINTETDQIAWFDIPEFDNKFQLTRDAALLSRALLERTIQRHFDQVPNQLQSVWPWGDYETSLLRHLAAAADRFWKNFDPEEPDTAETKIEVVKWLMARGVPERTAEAIDTILRAENLPKGPRRKK